MNTFIALYRGPTIGEARLIAVTADPEIISYVSGQLLTQNLPPDDPVLSKLDGGKRGALRAIQREAKAEDSLPEILRVIKNEVSGAKAESQDCGPGGEEK